MTATTCGCQMHGVHCEPPGDLCCRWCAERHHPFHPPGVACTWASAADVAQGQAVQRLFGHGEPDWGRQ